MAVEREETHSHSSPYHHVGPCDEACRRGQRPHRHRETVGMVGGPVESGATDQLYRAPGGPKTRREFEAQYAAEFRANGESPAEARRHAKYVYGATVGKVKRERASKE